MTRRAGTIEVLVPAAMAALAVTAEPGPGVAGTVEGAAHHAFAEAREVVMPAIFEFLQGA